MRSAILIVPRTIETTHESPLERLDDAFAAAEERPSGFIKGWVRI